MIIIYLGLLNWSVIEFFFRTSSDAILCTKSDSLKVIIKPTRFIKLARVVWSNSTASAVCESVKIFTTAKPLILSGATITWDKVYPFVFTIEPSIFGSKFPFLEYAISPQGRVILKNLFLWMVMSSGLEVGIILPSAKFFCIFEILTPKPISIPIELIVIYVVWPVLCNFKLS